VIKTIGFLMSETSFDLLRVTRQSLVDGDSRWASLRLFRQATR